MIRLLENAKLKTDLDFDGFDLKNPGNLVPVPDGILAADDPRLTDGRPVPNGSVTNDSVADTAEIDQSKLSFNGHIPTAWLGIGSDHAARGDLVERVSRRGAASGYAGLDANARVKLVNMTPSGNPGTVNSVKLSLPAELVPSPGTIVASGTFSVTWASEPDKSWFGFDNPIGLDAAMRPSFLTSEIPGVLIPSFDASKIASGMFPVEQLPVVTPLGVGHATGILTDPSTEQGDPSDYFGRDAEWHTVKETVGIQPTLPKVQITFVAFVPGGVFAKIQLSCPVKDSLLFYLVQDYGGTPVLLPYQETTNPIVIAVNQGFTVLAYAAKAGYNNSDINQFTIPRDL